MVQRKKEAPSLFIQKKKPPVKPPQIANRYLSEWPAPIALDADKIAKMDADLEKRGLNTLKGPKKAVPEKPSQLPMAQANAQKPVICNQKVQQPSTGVQTERYAAIEVKNQKVVVVAEMMDDTPMSNTVEGIVETSVAKQLNKSPVTITETAQTPAVPEKDVAPKTTVDKAQKPIVHKTQDITPTVSVQEVQTPVVEQMQDVTPTITVKEPQKPETVKSGIRRGFTSLLRARKSATIQMRRAISAMNFPEAPATATKSVEAAEQPKASQPTIAINLVPIAATPRTPPQASIPLPPSPVVTVKKTPPPVAVRVVSPNTAAPQIRPGTPIAVPRPFITAAPKTPPQVAIPLPPSPIDGAPQTPLAASIALTRSQTITTPKTPPEAAIPLPLSPIEAGAKTPPEALIPLPLSPIGYIPSTPPEAAIPLPASPVTEWRDTPPQASTPWPAPPVAAIPATPLQPAMAFPFTPETTTNATAPRAAFRYLTAPLAPAPELTRHVGSTLPPTPDTATSKIPQPHAPTTKILIQTPEPLPLYLPTPESQVPVAAPLAAAFYQQTPESPTPWIPPQRASNWAQTPETPSLAPQDVAEPMELYLNPNTGMRKTSTPIIYPQVAFTLSQTPENPIPEPCDGGDPMDLSSSIYEMSPGHSIHETPEMMDFVMSCIPKTSEPLAPWEIYFNKILANTITAFPANCRFEHPGANRQNSNPFSALTGGGNNNRGAFGRPAGPDAPPFTLNKDTIYKDLTEERPSWILSAYGAGRDAPEQLWGGYPIEQSFEEARLHFLMGQIAGNPQGALNDIQGLESQVQQKMQTALQNLDGAINFIVQSQNNHPNRNDVCQNGSSPSTGEFAVGKRPVGFQQASGPSNNPFGQPSAPNQQVNPFGGGGTSAFGQPSTLSQPSAFGQPSALGGGSAFGQPSTLGSNTGFGQASALGQKPSPFGQPSALGGGSAFGQPSALGSNTGFGQASALGQKPNPFGAPAQPSAFGQPSQPGGGGGGFGQPSALGAKPNPFASAASGPSASPFGAFSNNNSNNNNNHTSAAQGSSPFGALGGTSTNTGGFGNPQQTAPSPFGQPQQASSNEVSMDSAPTSTANAFGNAGNTATPSPFGQPAQPAAANPFARPSVAPTPFGAPAIQQQQQPAAAAGSLATGAGPYGPNATRQHPNYNSYAVKSPTGQLTSWTGKPVTYKMIGEEHVPGIQNFDGSWTKIWFPDGPPNYNKDTEPTRPYTDDEKSLYNNFMTTGKFQLAATGGGGMPLAPPTREMCTWNF